MSQKFGQVCYGVRKCVKVFEDAQRNGYALPAVNVIGTNSINAVLETARDLNSPVIIQFSKWRSCFQCWKGMKMDDQENAVLGSIAWSASCSYDG